MPVAYYSTTHPTSLAVALDSSSTTVQVLDGSSFPDPALTGDQYTVLIGYGSEREEVCTVTGKPTTTTLTVLRGQDGTPAIAKNVGDTVVHGVSAREFNAIAAKLDKAGGVMAGPLLLSGDAVAALEAVPLQQLEQVKQAALATRQLVSISGDTAAASAEGVDYVYVCSAALTLTLPSPAAVALRMYTVKSRTTGVVTVNPSGGLVDGVAGSLLLSIPNTSIDLVSDGTGWVIV